MRLDGEGRHWCIWMIAFGYFLHASECISIDNRLTIVKSDCYERIAIGQRIDDKNVSKKMNSKTFTECQMECTMDAEKCKAFSYGVGVKGNTTCEISSATIKETTSGSPEDAADDTDYDLYIKKMDCKFAGDAHPNIDAIEGGLSTLTTLQGYHTTQELEHHPISTTSDIPLPFNSDYKPKRRPGSYKKQHIYPELEHRQELNRKQDDGGLDENNFNGYIEAVSYNRYEKPEGLDNKNEEDDYKSYESSNNGYNKQKFSNKIPYDFIGSNGPPRGYGYSNLPENVRKPISLDSYYGYSHTSLHDYNKNKFPFRPSYITKPYDSPLDHTKPINNDGYNTNPTSLTTAYPAYHYEKPTHSSSAFGTTFQDPDNPNYPADSQKPSHQYDSSQNQFDTPSSGYPLDKPQQTFGVHHNHDSGNQKPYFSSIRPVMEHAADYESNLKRPNFGFLGGVYEFSNGEYKPYGNGGNSLGNIYSPKYPHQKLSLNGGYKPNAELEESYLTEMKNVCFKRILMGKRVSRAFVRKIVSCERVEDCQQECVEEKKFVCEGFNYRLGPSGRGTGDCELIDLPYVLLDPHKDMIINPNYDYYEKDRNTYQRCKDRDIPFRPQHSYPPSSSGWQDDQNSYDYGGGYRNTHKYDGHPSRPSFLFRLPPADDFRPYRRSDTVHTYYKGEKHPHAIKPVTHLDGYSYHTHPQPQFINDFDQKPYLPPPNMLNSNSDYDKRGSWGQYDYDIYGKGKPHNAVVRYDGKHEKLLPPTNYLPLPFDDYQKHWGEYGRMYGTGGYIPPKPDHYLPPAPSTDHLYQHSTYIHECSLRSATGYRLYKKVVKKILTVPTIYDCEMACFKETDFICTSYAFRYIVGSGIPPNNCYLSDRNYKELDYYTDLEQDRNFDIYTMNNKNRCVELAPQHRASSECFLHVRSGQRLDGRCVRDSLFVKSFLDCHLECLRAERFLCRSFSFRYGSAIIGGISENCQLSDIPFRELDPFKDLVSDPWFVLYERASYGYGCELDRVNDRYLSKQPSIASELDKDCYIGYGWPARLLSSATRKIIRVSTEEDCRSGCTRFRMETPFCCMSFTYRSTPLKDKPNCFLSDIFQRDLLETVDFVKDPDSWLFSWDSSNPQCRFSEYYEQRVPIEDRRDISLGTITWRIYSVGGWPCKRGTLCRQSELGFWFCELEGGSPSSWDYCCRPGHQCGFSEGYPYQWCYVGPSFTQWRKCSDKYYPYLPPPHFHTPDIPKPSTTYLPTEGVPSTPISLDYDRKPPIISTTDYYTFPPSTSIDAHVPKPTIFLEEPKKTYLPPPLRQPRPWQTDGKPLLSNIRLPYRPGFRPDRPNALPPEILPKPSLNEYEDQFDNLFLDPPKPGGFGQGRQWPISYLHKETPPNASTIVEHRFEQMKEGRDNKLEPKYETIKNLINVIKSNDLDNIKYQITNDSNKEDDILHVEIPLPSNFTKILITDRVVDDKLDKEGLLPPKMSANNKKEGNNNMPDAGNNLGNIGTGRNLSVYRRSYVVKTNITDARRWKFPENEFGSIR